MTATKGHWPKGKSRNNPPDGYRAVLANVRRKLRRNHGGNPKSSLGAKSPSHRKLAVKLRVNNRTVGRWLAGERLPAPKHVRAMQRWLESV